VIRVVAAFSLAAAVLLTVAGAAFAAKPPSPPADVDCGADGTFVVAVSPGNGSFTPARILSGGSGLLIPVAFSNQVGTFTDNEGNTMSEPEPDVSHPAPANKDLLSCHFTVSFSDDTGTFTFSGDVVAFMVPGR